MSKPKQEAMLDPWIIEEIRRREQQRQQEEDRRGQLEIQIDDRDKPEIDNDPVRIEINPGTDDKAPERGVIEIKTKKEQK